MLGTAVSGARRLRRGLNLRRKNLSRGIAMMKAFRLTLLGVLPWATTCSFLPTTAAQAAETDADRRARAFVAMHESQIKPLEIEVARSWWLANTTGKDEAFARKQELETQLDVALSKRERFAELK